MKGFISLSWRVAYKSGSKSKKQNKNVTQVFGWPYFLVRCADDDYDDDDGDNKLDRMRKKLLNHTRTLYKTQNNNGLSVCVKIRIHT